MAAPPVTSLTDLKKQWSDTAKDGLADAAAVIKDLQTLQTKAAKLQPTDPQFKSANDELEELKKRVRRPSPNTKKTSTASNPPRFTW